MVALHVPGAPGDALQLPPPGTLVLEIMNRKYRAHLGILVHPDRNHAGVPVMTVDNLGFPGAVPHELCRCVGKEREAPVLVLPPVHMHRVEAGVPHQVNGKVMDGVAGFIDGKVRPHGPATKQGLPGNGETPPEPAVARHDQTHVMSQERQRCGQGADHIPHATYLDHRSALGSSKEHAHGQILHVMWRDYSRGTELLPPRPWTVLSPLKSSKCFGSVSRGRLLPFGT